MKKAIFTTIILSLLFVIQANAQENLRITSNGKFYLNTNTLLGASDLTLKSTNPTSWGGMFIQSTDESNGRPFYGYAIGDDNALYHFWDKSTDAWRLYFYGDKFNIHRSGQIGIGVAQPDTSAILDLSSNNKGLLLPRMTTTNRNDIFQPAEGLLVFDETEKSMYLRKNSSWNKFENLWTEDDFPNGAYIASGNIAINSTSQFFSSFHSETDQININAGRFIANYSGSLQKTGVWAEAQANGTGQRQAFYAIAGAPATGSSAPAYGVRSEVSQNNSANNIYAIYGKADKTGTGESWAGYFDGDTKVEDELNIGDKIKIDGTGFNSAGEIEFFDNDGTRTMMLRGNQNTSQGAEIFLAEEDGSLTIEIDGDNNTQGGGYISIKDDLGQNRIVMHGKENNTQGADISLFNSLGQNTVELDADYGGTNRGRVIVDELEIKGGSDLAEYFDISTIGLPPTPGMVVSINPDKAGQLMLSQEHLDKKVVGIISGANGVNPGMMMGQKGTEAFGDIPVAIAGRVYVMAEESFGVIQPGDFLTTSHQVGHACKVTDLNAANGAILGKAMTKIDDNGFVLMLVNLN